MYTMGIDPGSANSAYAFYSKDDYFVFDATDTATRRSHILEYKPVFCVLEKVNLMPGQGAISGGKFMKAVGIWQGILETLQVPYQEVLPAAWARSAGLNIPKPEVAASKRKQIQKKYKLQEARKRFPQAELHLAKHIDRAESLWMSLCAHQIFNTKPGEK